MSYTISVLGLGFVGLTTGLAFAEKGNIVYGFDIDTKRSSLIASGQLPFIEPGLDKALIKHLNKSFYLTNDVIESAQKSDFIFLCVGTPAGEDGEADLKYIYSALDSLHDVISDNKFRVIVLKSTIPPSTTSQKVIPYLESKGHDVGKTFGIANNPEFLREGKCWEDMMNADRIVCGICDTRTENMLEGLYSSFNSPFFGVSLNTGEYIKYLSNTMLATMISYANEMSKVADTIGGIEVKEAFEILHMDRRWGGASMSSYVYPGSGYGGYCLPKDTQAMYAKSLSHGYEAEILKSVMKVNDSMPQFMAEKVISQFDKSQTIGILGLSFKPGSDDVRDSSSAKIIKLLLKNGYNRILAYDPVANEMFKHEYNLDIDYTESKEEILEKVDVIMLLTAWEEFSNIKQISTVPIIDCRYFL